MGRPLLGPYVNDPMHLQLSNSYVGIFVGVNYGEGRGGNIAGHNGLEERGGGESCMQIFFPHGVEWWDRRREKESQVGILFSHMERKRFGDELASCRYGEQCIISLILHAGLHVHNRYSLKSLKTYTPHTCSYFKVH